MAMAMPEDTRAVGRLLLPVIKLESSASSKQLEQRLNYLWATAHAMLATSPAIAHAAAATVMETARRQHTVLPSAVLDYLCQQCGGLLVPSISADVRVVSVTCSAPVNRKLARLQQKARRYDATQSRKTERLQNVVQIHCRRCRFANVRHGASVVYKPKDKKERKATRPQQTGLKRPPSDSPSSEAEPKRAKTDDAAATDKMPTSQLPPPAPAAPPPPRSVFAKPASPPRRLLDTKKKKKKPSSTDASAQQVKSSLDSFLQTLKKK